MNKTLFRTSLILVFILTIAGQLNAQQTLRVLLIGNSFSQNASRFLPQIAKEGGVDLVFGHAEMGGCSLKRHWDSVLVNNADTTKGKAYGGKSLRQLLSTQKWDVVTMQQYSLLSGDENTYQPYAQYLLDLVKQYQPNVKVLIHQTWAYRADAKSFGKINGEERAKDQQEMWQKSRAAYHKLAAALGGLTLIPSGDAFYRVSTDQQWSFKKDLSYTPENATYPELPNQQNSIHAGYFWNAKKKLEFDPNHANEAGCYLAGLVWYKILLGKDPSKITFKPEKVPNEFASFLRKTASETVK